ncbi:hypothetical protein KUCAC02_029929, partial [Chaenocephalus aceratus]
LRLWRSACLSKHTTLAALPLSQEPKDLQALINVDLPISGRPDVPLKAAERDVQQRRCYGIMED